jgi:hypothetical protein
MAMRARRLSAKACERVRQGVVLVHPVMLRAGAPAVWAMVAGAKNGGSVTAQLRREPSDEKLAAL